MPTKTVKVLRSKPKAKAKSPNGRSKPRSAAKPIGNFKPTKIKLLKPVPSDIDIAQAGKMEGGEVVDLLRQIAIGVAGRAPLPTNVPDSLEEQVQFAAAMARFAANLPELTAAIERANAQIRNGIQRP